MTTLAPTDDGSTPLSPEELADLIPNLATKQELNEWERQNILLAREWAIADRTGAVDVVSDEYVRKLHRKMFDETWKWAGEYRRTEKNIGVPAHEIREKLMQMFGDVRYWMENRTHSPDEIAVRFHHRLVLIHPFPQWEWQACPHNRRRTRDEARPSNIYVGFRQPRQRRGSTSEISGCDQDSR